MGSGSRSALAIVWVGKGLLGGRTSLGMAFVLLFAPSLSAAEAGWSAMPGVEVVEEPKSWSWRGWVDLGIFWVTVWMVGLCVESGLTVREGFVLRLFYIHVSLSRVIAAQVRHDGVKGDDVKMSRHVRDGHFCMTS